MFSVQAALTAVSRTVAAAEAGGASPPQTPRRDSAAPPAPESPAGSCDEDHFTFGFLTKMGQYRYWKAFQSAVDVWCVRYF